MKTTSGKWDIKYPEPNRLNNPDEFEITSESGSVIAKIPVIDNLEEAEANAKAIKAVPEMVNALKMASDLMAEYYLQNSRAGLTVTKVLKGLEQVDNTRDYSQGYYIDDLKNYPRVI